MTTVPGIGETQNDVEVLLCMQLSGRFFFMPDAEPQDRLRWAIPLAALMRVKSAYTEEDQ